MKRRNYSVVIYLLIVIVANWAFTASITTAPTGEDSIARGAALTTYGESNHIVSKEKKQTWLDRIKAQFPLIMQTRQAWAYERMPWDLFFVIDNSGSMIKNDPGFTTKRVVTRFIDQLEARDRCGVILFDSKAHLITPLTDMASRSSGKRLKTSLSKVNYKGQFSNSPAGIERAIYELRISGRDEASKNIIFLTDGIVDTGSARADVEKTKWLKEDLTAESRQLGIRIFGIAFTENADYHLIQSLALQTNGAYYRALDAGVMEQVFESITKDLAALPTQRDAEVQRKADVEPTTDAPELPPVLEASVMEEMLFESITENLAALPTQRDAEVQRKADVEPTTDTPELPPELIAPASTATPTVSSSESAKSKQLGEANPVTKVVREILPTEPVSMRGMWKIYLPLFVITLMLISILAFFVLKLKNVSGSWASRLFSSVPAEMVAQEHTIAVPESQLIDMGRACPDHEGPFKIEKPQITIGRDPQNDIVINRPTISGFHATINYDKGRFQLEDARSTNGTLINDRRIEPGAPICLKTGDCIKFADFEFRFIRLNRIPICETVMLSTMSFPPEAFSTTSEQPLPAERLRDCFNTVLSQQLEKISEMGERFAQFVTEHFDPFTVNLLTAKMTAQLEGDGKKDFEAIDVLHRLPIAYKLCHLPVSTQEAPTWFAREHGGFLPYLEEALEKEVCQQPGCHTLCIISYGRHKTPWVSLTIIPTEDNEHAVEIMSEDFLTPKEREVLPLQFDTQGRIISPERRKYRHTEDETMKSEIGP